MRILLVADFYPPHIGGVELQVQALGRELSRRGHEVHVATLRQPGLAGESSDDGVTVHRFAAASTATARFSGNPTRRYHPPLPDPLFALNLRRLARRIRPDVAMAHGWSAYSVALALIGTRIPLVLSVRDYGYTCAVRSMLLDGRICSGPGVMKCLRHATSDYGAVKGFAARVGVLLGGPLLRRRVAAVHSVSRYVAEVVRRDLLKGAPIPIVTLPDIVLASPDEREADVDSVSRRLPTEPYVLFVGALQPHKGLGPLLEAHGSLPHPPPLALVGTTWPDTPPTFPDGVAVITDVTHAAVMHAWKGALFGVAPSIWPDPLPGVVREGMIAGRAVIGSRAGGIPDMITDGETGLLVDPGDVQGLAAAMQRLIDAPELRARLGDAARRSASVYTDAAVAAQFEALFASTQPSAHLTPLPSTIRRIHVTGGSGTGKSTLAGRIGSRLALPVHHLDDIDQGRNGYHAQTDVEKRALAETIAAQRAWVTEGIHGDWTDPLVREADVILWLDDTGAASASVRVMRRFIRDSLTETRRRGLAGILRPRSYAHHLRQLITALADIRTYRTRPPMPSPDTREGLARQLRPMHAKVVAIRRPGDRAEFMRALEASSSGTGQNADAGDSVLP